jgi:hypothetical protein
MKLSIIALLFLFLTGCANKHQLYYDAAKSISKDNTMTQAACFGAVAEIAKNADNSAKVGAIALAEKCKNDSIKLMPPTNILGF